MTGENIYPHIVGVENTCRSHYWYVPMAPVAHLHLWIILFSFLFFIGVFFTVCEIYQFFIKLIWYLASCHKVRVFFSFFKKNIFINDKCFHPDREAENDPKCCSTYAKPVCGAITLTWKNRKKRKQNVEHAQFITTINTTRMVDTTTKTNNGGNVFFTTHKVNSLYTSFSLWKLFPFTIFIKTYLMRTVLFSAVFNIVEYNHMIKTFLALDYTTQQCWL